MNKDKLITQQQLQIEEYKQLLKENNKIRNLLIGSLFSIGQPLNDNNLRMDEDQLRWCYELSELINNINSID